MIVFQLSLCVSLFPPQWTDPFDLRIPVHAVNSTRNDPSDCSPDFVAVIRPSLRMLMLHPPNVAEFDDCQNMKSFTGYKRLQFRRSPRLSNNVILRIYFIGASVNKTYPCCHTPGKSSTFFANRDISWCSRLKCMFFFLLPYTRSFWRLGSLQTVRVFSSVKYLSPRFPFLFYFLVLSWNSYPLIIFPSQLLFFTILRN